MKKWLQTLDNLAKKGSKLNGKLGLVSRAVDSLIPDATAETAKQSKALGDVNTGTTDAGSAPITNTPDKVDQARLLLEMAEKEKSERTLSQKWGHMPTWAKGSIIAGGVGLIWMLIRSMKHSKKRRY